MQARELMGAGRRQKHGIHRSKEPGGAEERRG